MRTRLERTAGLLFATTAIVMATICGAIIISGWFAGVIEDRAERVFWAGAILALLGVLTLGVAAFPGGDNDAAVIRRVRALSRIGLAMFLVAPCLCLGALVADFYG